MIFFRPLLLVVCCFSLHVQGSELLNDEARHIPAGLTSHDDRGRKPEYHSIEKSGQAVKALTTRYPGVGSVFRGFSLSDAMMKCSGTLVASDLVLTAAHCITGREENDHYWFYLQHAGMVPVSRKGTETFCDHYACDDEPGASNDLAILRLKYPVHHLNAAMLPDNNGLKASNKAIMVGMGISTPGAADFNLKRQTTTWLAKCSNGSLDDRFMCSKPGSDLPKPCHLDSGGSLLQISTDGNLVQTGMAIRTGIGCSTGQAVYHNTASTAFSAWIGQHLESSRNRRPLDSLLAREIYNNPGGWLGGELKESINEFIIPSDMKRIIVTLNHSPGLNAPERINNFDLELFKPLNGYHVGTESTVLCENSWKLVSVCRVESPAPGRWHAKITRIRGEGHFQLVATGFDR